MAYHYVHHQIEDGGQQRVPLRHASIPAEGFSLLPSHPIHHLDPLPVTAKEAEGPGTHTIYLQDIQAHGHIQGVLCLVQVQENRVKDLLPHGRNLLPLNT